MMQWLRPGMACGATRRIMKGRVMMRFTRRSSRGFTLIEVLVALAILAITVPSLTAMFAGSAQTGPRIAARIAGQWQGEAALDGYMEMLRRGETASAPPGYRISAGRSPAIDEARRATLHAAGYELYRVILVPAQGEGTEWSEDILLTQGQIDAGG